MNLDYPDNEFRTILVDPPWSYDDQPPRGGAEKHYETMDLEDIKAIEVERIAADEAHLYLWTTNSFMGEALEVAEAWGFEQKTIITWIKDSIGTGWYFRNSTEHILFCTRGDLKTTRSDIPTHFEAPRREHSKKPPEFMDMIEDCSPPPAIELFARATYDGWEGVGAEQFDVNSAADW